MDKIRNEYIRGTAQVGRFGKKVREARLRWFGHVLSKNSGILGEVCCRWSWQERRNGEGIQGGLLIR